MPYGKGASKAFAIATAQAKKKGYTSFKKGSRGYEMRSKIAEAIGSGKSGMGFHRKG